MHRFPFLAFATLMALGACAPAAEIPSPQITQPAELSVIRSAKIDPGAGKSVYDISWTSYPQGAPVDIEVSPDPDFTPGSGTLIAENVTEAPFTWSPENETARQYFLIVPDAGTPVRVSNRLLPLEGGRNFRDMGGYATVSGQSLKWGKLYRSGAMNNLTPADYDYLSELGINVICDLRTAEERAAEPTTWTAGKVEYLSFPDPESTDTMGFMTVFQSPDVTPEKVSHAMAAGYSHMAKEQAPAYREMFNRLAAGEAPLAFNCSAGKDRTGIGAALILTALGVPRETIVADYALSETYVDYMQEFGEAATNGAADDSPYAFMAQLPPEVIAPLMRSDPLYLETAFDDIDAEYGSVMGFIQNELGVTDEMLNAMRRDLLESISR